MTITSATTAPTTPPDPQMEKLKKGAREFEAMLMQQLWKGMRDPKEDSGDGSGSGEAMTDLGMQAMAQGMAAHGGLGIGNMILQQKKLK